MLIGALPSGVTQSGVILKNISIFHIHIDKVYLYPSFKGLT